jgi:hypothetical protein
MFISRQEVLEPKIEKILHTLAQAFKNLRNYAALKVVGDVCQLILDAEMPLLNSVDLKAVVDISQSILGGIPPISPMTERLNEYASQSLIPSRFVNSFPPQK